MEGNMKPREGSALIQVSGWTMAEKLLEPSPLDSHPGDLSTSPEVSDQEL